MNVGYLIAAVSLITAAAVIAAERGKSARLLRRMDKMLEQAMTQGFTEQDYDESMLSSVETKLARYLASSSVSARNLQEEKDKIKTLVADISHQTKTPLANILLYTQLLAEKPLDGESRECVERLEGQAEKLRSLIEALVKTSRLESGVLALQPRPSPLAPMLREAVTQFAPAAEEKGISLTLASSDGDGTFDPKWTVEAVCNPVGAGSISLLLSAVINPLAGRIFENAYWFYSYRFTMTPVLLAIPAFALLGCVIPAIMYKQSTKRSIVECLREAEN